VSEPDRRRPPWTLLATGALVGLEGLVVAGVGVVELLDLHSGRVTLALTTAAFFLLVGAGLVLCAWGLSQVRSWARGPVVAVELVGLLLAFSFWGGETTPASVVIFVVSLVVLVGVLHPASTQALAASDG
jgi:peptidoglycan/LPS O-acetylase OafA/YrhL